MIQRMIDVEVDGSTWPRGASVPWNLSAGGGSPTIDLGSAFLMLGTLTMPDLLSPASPALFWAWLRYYLAPTAAADLRITMDFAGLDPHQKSILSDDFGVAFSTQWLFDRLGGFREIVDGRRFMVQFAHLLPPKIKPTTAKVGPGKAPDFVIKDMNGRWHVLECKGTQSGRAQRDTYLNDALAQKQAIQITGRLRGERLAAGLAISNQQSTDGSHMRIIDPADDQPMIELGDQQSDEIDLAARRITVARALGVVGLGEAAVELSLPERAESKTRFLRKSEAARLRAERGTRRQSAQKEILGRRLQSVPFNGLQYEGRTVDFGDLPFDPALGFQRLRVTQGVNHELIEEMAGTGIVSSDDALAAVITNYTKNPQIKIVSNSEGVTLTYGHLLFSRLEFL
jgi:hypothetical protein